MKEHPILFSTGMVQAILAGRKTQTRRVIVPQFTQLWGSGVPHGCNRYGAHVNIPLNPPHPRWGGWAYLFCPYGRAGDRLWVRETWGIASWYQPVGDEQHRFEAVRRRATDPDDSVTRWHPSIHMPRWASRITLEITGIRVQRVQEISEADAAAEGVPPNWCGNLAGWDPVEHGYLGVCKDKDGDSEEGYHRTAREAYQELWDSLNAKRGCGWDANPWVWAINFKRIDEREIDPDEETEIAIASGALDIDDLR